MSYTLVLPVEISNQYGNQKYVLNLPLFKFKSTSSANNFQILGEEVLSLIQEIKIIEQISSTLILRLFPDKEKEIINRWSLTKLYPKTKSGFSINLSKKLQEAPWKLKLLGNLSAIIKRPIIFPIIEEDYPEYDF